MRVEIQFVEDHQPTVLDNVVEVEAPGAFFIVYQEDEGGNRVVSVYPERRITKALVI